MERTKYYNDTKPGETQLDNTEDSKIRAMLRRFRSTAQMGVRVGFRITINAANATKIDISPGEGYGGGYFDDENLRADDSGERISTLSESGSGGTSIQGVGLTDYSLNAKNYVSLVYAEIHSMPLMERSYPFTSHNTIISESYTTEVVTEVTWNAYTASQLEDRVLVCIVTAQGAGNPLSLSNVDQLVQPKNHPIPGTQPSSITGVTIDGISNETIIGTGTLRFETATKKLYWTAPGDAEGTGVAVTSGGSYTLYSDDASYWVTVHVVYASLPIANTTESIEIHSLYGRTIPLASAVDQAHRDMVGTGIQTEQNTHGLSINDLTGGTFDHADLFHVNGISGDADSDQLVCTINHVTDSIEIENNGGFNNSFLIDGKAYTLIDGYVANISAILAFDILPALDSGDYLIYLDSAAKPNYVKIAGYVPGGPADFDVLWSGNIEITDIQNDTAGNGVVTWDSGHESLTYEAPGDGAAGAAIIVVPDSGTTINGYYKLYSSNTDNWIIVHCKGDIGASNSSTFAIAINETDQPEDSILKLAVVTWNATGDAHDNIRDIREFNTADNRKQVREEHDSNGQHTIPLRNTLKLGKASTAMEVNVLNRGIMATAITATAIYGLAVSKAVVAYASIYAISASASATAIYGTASAKAGSFLGSNDVLCASASNTGAGSFVASAAAVIAQATDGAVSAFATNVYAFYGSASASAVVGKATATGVYGSAEHYGVVGFADVAIGVDGHAPNTAGRFNAVVATGISCHAPNIAGYFSADVNYAVSALASANAVYAHATANTGVFGSADNVYGVYGKADANGVFGSALQNGVGGTAVDHNVGGNVVGVSGGASNLGDDNSAIGVEGYVAGVGATGIIGLAGGIGATGIVGKAVGGGNDTGIYGTAAGFGIVGTCAAGGYAIRGIAPGTDLADGWGLGVVGWITASMALPANQGASVTNLPIVVNGTEYRIALYASA